MGVSVQFRRGTAAAWTAADPTLLPGEVGFETDTNKFKIGDGVTVWTVLAYVAGDITGSVLETDYHENTILKADADHTPIELVVGAQEVIGRLTGGTIDGIAIGIADDNIVQVDDASAADDEFARFTANGIEGLTVAEAIAALLAVALPENTAIILDSALSADGKYSGIVEAGVLGETVAYGETIYLKSDGQWYLAKADVAATSINKLGICLDGGADEDATVVLLWGKVRADAKFPALTIGAPVYISAAAAGALVTTAPTGTTGFIVRIVGYGNTADELFFNPENDWLELA